MRLTRLTFNRPTRNMRLTCSLDEVPITDSSQGRKALKHLACKFVPKHNGLFFVEIRRTML